MSRSKLRQKIQISATENADYNDAIASGHSIAVAEGGLEDGYTISDDLNIIRTQLKDLKGDDNGLSMSLVGSPMHIFADAFGEQFFESGATNFLAVNSA